MTSPSLPAGAGAGADADAVEAWLLRPVEGAQPCGPSLEYDPAYVLVMARLTPTSSAQYGAFIDKPVAPDWSEIARVCETLLRRTRDIPLLIGWCRARLALAHAPGIADALALLHAVLTRWPDDVHPQLRIDDADEPMVRANAVAALADPDGLLGQIGDLVLLGNTAMRLTVRDVARSLAIPRAANAAEPAAVGRYLHEMRAGTDVAAAAQCQALQQAATCVGAIETWSQQRLGDEAPSLTRLLRLLAPFATTSTTPSLSPSPSQSNATLRTPPSAARDAPATAPSPTPPMPPMPPIHPMPPMHPAPHAQPDLRARHDAAACIRAAREWFEMHEPSSPVAVLLKQAERMVGQRFVQVADAIPLELLRQWDARPDASNA